MKASELIENANRVAESSTMYLQGGSGQRLTKTNQLKFAGSTIYNSTKSKKIYAADENTRAFDVIGLIKFLIKEEVINVTDVMNRCIDISKDFSTIIPGELVFLKDRIGVYVGGKKVVTANENGVSAVDIDGWASHGKLASVDYAGPAPEVVEPEEKVEEETNEQEPEEVSTPVEPIKETNHEESEQRQERHVEFRHDRGRNRH